MSFLSVSSLRSMPPPGPAHTAFHSSQSLSFPGSSIPFFTLTGCPITGRTWGFHWGSNHPLCGQPPARCQCSLTSLKAISSPAHSSAHSSHLSLNPLPLRQEARSLLSWVVANSNTAHLNVVHRLGHHLLLLSFWCSPHRMSLTCYAILLNS